MTNMSQKKLYPWPERDPLVDVIECGATVRVIVALPRIMAEDVWFSVRDGSITVEISKYGQIFRKEVPCRVRSESLVAIRSSLLNSVLEVVFKKISRHRRHIL